MKLVYVLPRKLILFAKYIPALLDFQAMQGAISLWRKKAQCFQMVSCCVHLEVVKRILLNSLLYQDDKNLILRPFHNQVAITIKNNL